VEWQADVAHPVLTMHVVSALQIPHQGSIRADVHWNGGSDEVAGIEGVLRGLLDRAVAGDRRDPQYFDVGMLQSHEQGDGIVGRGVGIDEELAQRHARNLGDRCWGYSAHEKLRGVRLALIVDQCMDLNAMCRELCSAP